jgi:hypothetical protein
MKFRDLFLSKEHLALRNALQGLNVTDGETLKESLANIEKAYTVLVMIEHTVAAKKELNSPRPDDRKFLSSFSSILDKRNKDAHPATFQVANYLARDLAQVDNSSGPDTLVQTQALDKLQQHYFAYARYWGGYFEGGSAGIGNFVAAVEAGVLAARGYKKHGDPASAQRVYGEVDSHLCGMEGYSDTIMGEIKSGAADGKPAKPGFN